MSVSVNHYLASQPLFHTSDLDEARAFMGAVWCDHQVDLREGSEFETSVRHVDLNQTGLTYVDCASALRIRVRPTADRYFVYFAENGASELTMNQRRSVLDPQTAVVVGPGLDLAMDTAPARVLSLDFSRQRIENVLIEQGVCPRNVEEWAAVLDLHTPPARALQSLCRWVGTELNQQGSPLTSGLAAAQISETLLALFLDALTPLAPTLVPRDGLVGKLRFSDLEAWVEANLKTALSVEVLAQLAGVSHRAIQNSFRRYRGCTPRDYIRMKRLEAIHRQLQSDDPRISVSGTAMDYGLFHLSRFALEYQKQFGERPSTTRQRARGPTPRPNRPDGKLPMVEP